jgi:hypothetical protein
MMMFCTAWIKVLVKVFKESGLLRLPSAVDDVNRADKFNKSQVG